MQDRSAHEDNVDSPETTSRLPNDRNASSIGGETSESPTSDSLSEIQAVVSRYVAQLLYGCGDSTCNEVLCDTGRRNLSPGPVRKYTPRSARIIAITIAGGHRPKSHLCPKFKYSSVTVDDPPSDGPRDPGAIIQQLSDTRSIRELCTPRLDGKEDLRMHRPPATTSHDPDLAANLAYLRKTLAKIIAFPDPTTSTIQDILETRRRTVDQCSTCVLWLRSTLPGLLPGNWRHVNETISEGCVYPPRSRRVPNTWIRLSDAMNHGESFRLFCHVINLLGKTMEWERNAAEASIHLKSMDRDQLDRDNAIQRFTEKIDMKRAIGDPSFSANLDVIIWLKKAFLRYWDGNVNLTFGTVAHTSLSILHHLHKSSLEGKQSRGKPDKLSHNPESDFLIPAVAARTDAADIAQTWLNGQHEDHLLQFGFIFNINQQATYFRTMNHIRMLKAYCDAQKALRLRNEADPQIYAAQDINRERIMSKEQHHLLLSVSRMNVLGDAFDQLWHRRKSELLRPLRVRLGEEDAFEVGHDLGGVQIEFFNVVCRYLFREDLQMFTTDSTTGFSYFRPGCLQPLYMFELCGLLFALALYNGITLPIRLPEIYYGMLSGRSEDIEDPLADAWPKDRKALSEIAEYDIPGLQFTFPIESNGLRLSVLMGEHTSAHEDFAQGQRRTMQVVDATAIAHHPDPSNSTVARQQSTVSSSTSPPLPIDIQTIATSWPGWHLVPADTEPPDIDPSNTALYTSLYTAHLTHLSVQPQLDSFLTGFTHILPPSLLRALSLPNLRTLLEGDTHFSLPELQAITHYEGYEPTSPYITSFWRVLDRWPVAKQMRLLKFVTACERVPAGGVGSLTFVVKRIVDYGDEEGSGGEPMLPTSSTCFGTLGLPEYESEEVLERKLGLALEFGLEGFGVA